MLVQVYTGPVDIVPEASVRNKGLPTLVWSTPLGELFEAELRFAMVSLSVISHALRHAPASTQLCIAVSARTFLQC